MPTLDPRFNPIILYLFLHLFKSKLDPDLRFSSEDVLDHFWTLNTASINKFDELIDLS